MPVSVLATDALETSIGRNSRAGQGGTAKELSSSSPATVTATSRAAKIPENQRRLCFIGPAHSRSAASLQRDAVIAGAAQPFSASHTLSGVAGMLMCLPPSASEMAFITEGREPAQPASPQPLAPSTFVLAGTE